MTAEVEKIVARAITDAFPAISVNGRPVSIAQLDAHEITAKMAANAALAALAAAGFKVLARPASEEMRLVGARDIGNTMGEANHWQRATSCWQSMWDAAAPPPATGG